MREVADKVGISETSCHQILTENLGIQHVVAKFVLRLLTDDYKQKHLEVSQELFDHTNSDENFLKNMITGDETWVYSYEVETRAQFHSGSQQCDADPRKHKFGQMWR